MTINITEADVGRQVTIRYKSPFGSSNSIWQVKVIFGNGGVCLSSSDQFTSQFMWCNINGLFVDTNFEFIGFSDELKAGGYGSENTKIRRFQRRDCSLGHTWVNTGMKKSWCRDCNVDAEFDSAGMLVAKVGAATTVSWGDYPPDSSTKKPA